MGDRVLLGNKGERGKQKLADKWEPTVYTVVDNNPQTHIYKLEDNNGKMKAVHRNLILDISFLPVESASGGTSDTEDSLDVSEDDSQMEDLEDRTSACILSGAEDGASHRFCDEVDTDEDGSDAGTELDRSLVSDVASGFDISRIQSFRPVIVPAVDILDTVSSDHTTHTPTVIPDTVSAGGEEQGPVSQVPTQADTQGVASTRAGRVVRKVNRLVETMVQTPLSLGGFVC